jgi:phosphomannomutase
MNIISSTFKANDIRGIYPSQLDEEFAYALGCGTVEALGARKVVLGYDARLSSPALHNAIAAAMKSKNARVDSCGMCPIELLYYIMGEQAEYDMAAMITASHNPAEYNGFKLVRAGGCPLNYKDGLEEVKRYLESYESPKHHPDCPEQKQTVWKAQDYLRHVVSIAKTPADSLKVVVDPGNGTGGILWELLEPELDIELIRMNFEPDGRFPAHEPNPADPANYKSLQERVIAEDADVGFTYDGDADRTVAILGGGQVIDGSQMIGALIHHIIGEKSEPGECAVSMNTSRQILDYLRSTGSDPLIVPVGHSKVKRIMQSDQAVKFAGEESGHYFYREFSCCESSMITTLHILEMVGSGEIRSFLDGLPAAWKRQPSAITFPFARRDEALRACRKVALKGLAAWETPVEVMCEHDRHVKRNCSKADIEKASGIRIDYDDFWFSARPSGTEPLARLAGEARQEKTLQSKMSLLSDEFKKYIKR